MKRSALRFGLAFVLCLSSAGMVRTAFSQVSAGYGTRVIGGDAAHGLEQLGWLWNYS